MNDDARHALADIVGAHGAAALSDPRRIRAMLRDAVPAARLEVSLLVAALEDGVPERLQHTSAGLVGAEIERLAAQLEADRGFAPGNAEWAVRTIAWALAPHGEVVAGSGRPGAPQRKVAPPPPFTATPSSGGQPPWQPSTRNDWAWVPIAPPGGRPAVPVVEPRRERTPNRAVRTVVIAACSALVLAAGVVGVVLATREPTVDVSAPVQRLLDVLPDEYSQAGVCRPWSDPDRPALATPLAAVECDPAKASWPETGFSPDRVRFERYGEDEDAATALMALERSGSGEPCPDAAYAPQPPYDGEGFRERYSCAPTGDGSLRLMRVWEAGVIGVVYPDPDDLDAHYAWFEGPQAAVG